MKDELKWKIDFLKKRYDTLPPQLPSQSDQEYYDLIINTIRSEIEHEDMLMDKLFGGKEHARNEWNRPSRNGEDDWKRTRPLRKRKRKRHRHQKTQMP